MTRVPPLPGLLIAAGLLALLALLALGGCSGDQLTRTFGLERNSPDEFTVTTRAPLSIPPDFSLPPPTPGASRPQEISTQSAAEAALAPQTALGGTGGPDSAGQDALVRQAGPGAPTGIRHQVDQEAGLDRPARGFADALLFWHPTPPSGTALDPVGESQRLKRDAALGQSPLTGNTPIIQTTAPKPGFLGIF